MKSGINLKRLMVTANTTKRWWVPLLILTIALINMAGLVLPKKYEATGIVKIHEPKVLMERMAGQVGASMTITDRIKTIREEMTSYSFLQSVARKVNLDAGIREFTPQYDKFIEKMRKSFELRVKETDLFAVSFKADDPQKAEKTPARLSIIIWPTRLNTMRIRQRRTRK